MRGSRTHGRGNKAGRGAGLIGGRGMAGLGKTGKMRMLKYFPDYFGRHGFKRPQSQVHANVTINVSELQESLDEYITKGFAVKEGDAYSVDLTKAGIDKLLGSGNIEVPVNVTVSQSSDKARQKLEASGGSIAE
ncbi:MAG TPA: uL15 family ribosomal protein [Candidatus Methanomethylophilaceae archaeon]|nr:uL15 family ribosomal protein [Candidatus Methanomethylophilaceae archaeon]